MFKKIMLKKVYATPLTPTPYPPNRTRSHYTTISLGINFPFKNIQRSQLKYFSSYVFRCLFLLSIVTAKKGRERRSIENTVYVCDTLNVLKNYVIR